MKNFLGFACLLLIAGCASTQTMHNAVGLSEDQLALVIQEPVSWSDNKFKAWISDVYALDGKPIIKNDSFWNPRFWSELRIEPGEYVFVVKCEDPYLYSYPEVAVRLEASTEYTVSCEKVVDEDGGPFGMSQIVGANAKIVPSEPVTAGK